MRQLSKASWAPVPGVLLAPGALGRCRGSWRCRGSDAYSLGCVGCRELGARAERGAVMCLPCCRWWWVGGSGGHGVDGPARERARAQEGERAMVVQQWFTRIFCPFSGQKTLELRGQLVGPRKQSTWPRNYHKVCSAELGGVCGIADKAQSPRKGLALLNHLLLVVSQCDPVACTGCVYQAAWVYRMDTDPVPNAGQVQATVSRCGDAKAEANCVETGVVLAVYDRCDGESAKVNAMPLGHAPACS